MGAAAAEIGRQLVANLRLAGVRIAVEQGLGRHDHAVHAVATLRRLLLNESLLHRVRVLTGADAFEGGDFPAFGTGQREHTRPRRNTIDDHRAGTALAQATTVFRAVEL
ncbi:hypothetical protein D3C76_1462600 [compost metagenome]